MTARGAAGTGVDGLVGLVVPGRIVQLLVAVSLVLVVLAVGDVVRRPTSALGRSTKLSWIFAMVGGLLLFGVVGGAIASVYLLRVRRRFPPTAATPIGRTPPTDDPAPSGSASASAWIPAGWYPDPSGQGRLRWWDGRSWTADLRA